MTRYFATTWNPTVEADCRTASLIRDRLILANSSWVTAFDHGGLFILRLPRPSGGDQLVQLGGGAGMILGNIFRCAPDCGGECTVLPSNLADLTEEVVASSGRNLISDYWGSFVLFLSGSSNSGTYVLRSPMAGIQCFHARFRGVSMLFSDAEDCASLALIPLSVNWDCIRAQATNGDYLTRETGLNEIESLEPGERLHIVQGRCDTSMHWNPMDIARSEEIEVFEDAVRALHHVTHNCVSAWASGHERILHTLSGGLDSSIVLACLRRAPTDPQVTCVTQYSNHPEGDERTFARCMASHAGTPLIERERDRAMNLEVFLNCAQTARPALEFSGYDSEQLHAQLTQTLDATAVFDGELGDNVFGHAATQGAVADYVLRHGVTPRLLNVALDFASLRKMSVWRILYGGLRVGLSRSAPLTWSAYRYAKHHLEYEVAKKGLISSAALDAYEKTLDRFIHPWMHDVTDVPPSKLPLIYALTIVCATPHYSVFSSSSAAPHISPLTSQPIVECALRIASHLHINSGQPRAVARSAFYRELPLLVLARRGKGSPGFWMREVVEHNRAFLHDVLADGLLVAHGILDRTKIEAVLSGSVSSSMVAISDVIVQLFIEAWLRKWKAIRLGAPV